MRQLQNKRALIAAALVFGVVGTYLLASSHALTPTASLEAEDGTVSGSATIINNANASGGQAVKFGSGTGTTLLDTPKIGVYLSGNAANSGTYPGTRMGSLYYNNTPVNITAVESRIDKGESLNITAAAPNNPYISGIINGNSAAMSWMNTFISQIKTVSDYAKAKNNGTYIVASIYSEANGRITQGQLPDYDTVDAASGTAVGQAQQIFIRALKQNAPNAIASVWNMGYSHVFEAAQLAQITNPKPDIISEDPYENHLCTGSLSTVTSGTGSYSITWYKSQPAYNGYVAISESGMATNNGCSDAQIAAFYTNIKGQIQTLEASSGVKIPFWVMFNGTGSYPHDITTGSYPKAEAALAASIANQ
jgi:hypothetical protein